MAGRRCANARGKWRGRWPEDVAKLTAMRASPNGADVEKSLTKARLLAWQVVVALALLFRSSSQLAVALVLFLLVRSRRRMVAFRESDDSTRLQSLLPPRESVDEARTRMQRTAIEATLTAALNRPTSKRSICQQQEERSHLTETAFFCYLAADIKWDTSQLEDEQREASDDGEAATPHSSSQMRAMSVDVGVVLDERFNTMTREQVVRDREGTEGGRATRARADGRHTIRALASTLASHACACQQNTPDELNNVREMQDGCIRSLGACW